MTSVLTLTETPLPADWVEGTKIRLKHIPMRDHELPGVKVLDEAASYIQGEVEGGRPLLVHCLAGKGRTGSALAAYLMKTQGRNAKQAIEFLRGKRPGSIERAQERALNEYERFLEHAR